jgi:hypothetical protein
MQILPRTLHLSLREQWNADGGCTTSTFVRNNVEYKYSVETVEVINFLNLLFATHMIFLKIWLLKCFTYNFGQTSPLARLWESTTRKLTKFWLREWFLTTLTCSSRIHPAFTMANCMLLAQELDLQRIFWKIPSFHIWVHIKTNDAHQDKEEHPLKECCNILE